MEIKGPGDLWTAAFAAFDTSDVSVGDALRHLADDLPHLRLLQLRRTPSAANVEEARSLLGAGASPWLVEGFVARPLDRLGAVEEALSTRLEALPRAARWEGLLAAHLLVQLGRGALRLGKIDQAVAASRRALRLVPLEPLALAALAEALAARGDVAESRSVRALLWDCAYGPDVLAGEPTSEERAATPMPMWFGDLEPMSVEDRARYAVASLHDPSLTDTVTGVVRHVAVQLRCGHVAQARATLDAVRAWEPTGSTTLQWLGFEGDTDRRDRTRTILLNAVEASAEGAQAVAVVRQKAPHVAHTTLAGRLSGVTEAPPEAVEPALLDFYVGVRQAARLRLATHPLVAAAHAIEVADPSLPRFHGGEPLELYGQAQNLAGLWRPGAASEPDRWRELDKVLRMQEPADPGGGAPYSFIEPARAAKPVCKACKTPFEIGEPQLRLRGEHDLLAKAVPHHVRCATNGKPKAALAFAAPRYRRADLRGGA